MTVSDEDHRGLSKLRSDALAAAEFFRRAPALAVSADAVIDLYCEIARTADVIEALTKGDPPEPQCQLEPPSPIVTDGE